MLGGLTLSGIFLLAVKWRQSRIRSAGSAKPGGRNIAQEMAGRLALDRAERPGRPNGGSQLLQWALQTTPAGVVLPIIAMAPIVVIPITLLAEGDRPSLHSLIGGAIAVAGVIALTLSR